MIEKPTWSSKVSNEPLIISMLEELVDAVNAMRPDPKPKPEALRGGDVKSGGGELWVFDEGNYCYRRTMLKGDMPAGPVLFNVHKIAAAVQNGLDIHAILAAVQRGEKVVTLTDEEIEPLMRYLVLSQIKEFRSVGDKFRKAMERTGK